MLGQFERKSRNDVEQRLGRRRPGAPAFAFWRTRLPWRGRGRDRPGRSSPLICAIADPPHWRSRRAARGSPARFRRPDRARERRPPPTATSGKSPDSVFIRSIESSIFHRACSRTLRARSRGSAAMTVPPSSPIDNNPAYGRRCARRPPQRPSSPRAESRGAAADIRRSAADIDHHRVGGAPTERPRRHIELVAPAAKL